MYYEKRGVVNIIIDNGHRSSLVDVARDSIHVQRCSLDNDIQ